MIQPSQAFCGLVLAGLACHLAGPVVLVCSVLVHLGLTCGAARRVDIITDAGEEVDDEVALWTVIQECRRDPRLRVRAFFTDPDGRARFMGMLDAPLPRNFHAASISELTPPAPDTVLLQIGPVRSRHLPAAETYVDRATRLRHVLLGECGRTLNSQRDARPVADAFCEGASQAVVVRSTAAVPCFTPGVLPDAFLGLALDVAMRNLVGRARPGGGIGKFIVHLVAEAVGANYRAAASLGSPAEEVEVDEEAIHATVEAYLALLEADGLRVQSDGRTNSVRGVTRDQIVQGYAFILRQLARVLGLQPRMYFSRDATGAWDRQWVDRTRAPKSLNDARAAFEELVTREDRELTPAYDVVAAALALDVAYQPVVRASAWALCVLVACALATRDVRVGLGVTAIASAWVWSGASRSGVRARFDDVEDGSPGVRTVVLRSAEYARGVGALMAPRSTLPFAAAVASCLVLVLAVAVQ